MVKAKNKLSVGTFVAVVFMSPIVFLLMIGFFLAFVFSGRLKRTIRKEK